MFDLALDRITNLLLGATSHVFRFKNSFVLNPPLLGLAGFKKERGIE